ncbi:MAG: PcfJ domain-containing protein, partial [Clostridia bacterium]
MIEEAIKKLQHNEWYKEIREVIGNDKEKFIAYLGRQQARISSYGDYLAACNYLGVDMTVDKNRYPHDFKRWHDIRIDEYHTAIAVADEKKRTKLNEQFEQVAEKYIALEKLANTKNNEYNFVA